MNTTFAQAGFEWTRPSKREATTVPLDDFLSVRVAQLPQLRSSIKTFLADHCDCRPGLSFFAARAKLIADFVPAAEEKLTFGEVVKQAKAALSRSELRAIRLLDPGDLARAVCAAA
jgi:hypothetical protein